MKRFFTLILASAFAVSSSIAIAAKTTKIEHGNGERTTIKSDREGSKIERGGTVERTRETHKEAVDRVKGEAKDRGEKATASK